MRNENGVYIGDTTCEYNRGVRKIEDRICCGGRHKNVAHIQCTVKGVVLAEVVCNSRCIDQKAKGK
jgi:hypothetical protein